MKAQINYVGTLTIIAENKTELYALKKWVEDSLDYSEDDLININMGSFDISDNFVDPETNPNFEISLLDHIMEDKA